MNLETLFFEISSRWAIDDEQIIYSPIAPQVANVFDNLARFIHFK